MSELDWDEIEREARSVFDRAVLAQAVVEERTGPGAGRLRDILASVELMAGLLKERLSCGTEGQGGRDIEALRVLALQRRARGLLREDDAAEKIQALAKEGVPDSEVQAYVRELIAAEPALKPLRDELAKLQEYTTALTVLQR